MLLKKIDIWYNELYDYRGEDMARSKHLNVPLLTYTIIDLILIFILMVNVTRLSIFPFKYIMLIVLILFLLFTITLLFQKVNKHKKLFRIISYILFTIMFIGCSIGVYYTGVTIGFLKKSFNTVRNTYKNNFILISTKDDIYGVASGKVGYYKIIPHIDKALEKLNETIETENIGYIEILELFSDLDKGKISGLFIEESIYNSIKENINTINYSNYNKLHTVEITIDEDVRNTNINTAVNIYIGGYDFTKTNTDFNMIITINRKKHQILLTSIPRDYHIEVPSIGKTESLEFMGEWGINMPMEALQNLFNIKLDYYLQINTDSLVGLVDTLGGVEFCTDKPFRTTHALILDTYDDSKGKKLYVEAGCHEYNGIEILTIARERRFDGGDRVRQENCRQIMINIFNKMLNMGSVAKYKKILDNLSDLYTTNIPDKLITMSIKDALNGKKWTIETQSVNGKDSRGYVHMGTVPSYVMIPDMDTVSNAIEKIKEISE